MSAIKKFIFGLFIFCAVFLFASAVYASEPSIPVISEISKQDFVTVKGVIKGEEEVLIYIDGTYAGTANKHYIANDTYSFYYESVNSNFSLGEHSVMAIGRDKTSAKLSCPAESFFIISESYPKAKQEANLPSGRQAIPAIKQEAVLPAPTIITPDKKIITTKIKPTITGLTFNDTRIHIYVDGESVGVTGWLSHVSGTANFAYTLSEELKEGEHTVWAIAEDKNGRKSKASNKIELKVEMPMPAPTLLPSNSEEVVLGLAKNNSLIKIFINNKFDGEFMVKNDKSGTANFEYKSKTFSREGKYSVYATATDKSGKESIKSNIVSLTTKKRKQISAISENENLAKAEVGKEETKDELQKTPPECLNKGAQNKGECLLTEDGDKAVSKEEENLTENKEAEELKKTETKSIEDILNEIDISESEIKNEAKASGGKSAKSKLNLFIFLAFLLGIIAWIFWVNRELIKEEKKEKNNTKDDSQKDDLVSRSFGSAEDKAFFQNKDRFFGSVEGKAEDKEKQEEQNQYDWDNHKWT